MLTIKTFQVNPIQENTYIIHDDSKECIIIDCGAYYPEEEKAIANYINKNELHPKFLLCTHGHFDHIFGNHFVFQTYGLKPRVHQDDAQLMNSLNSQCGMMGIVSNNDCADVPAGEPLRDNEIIPLGHHQFKVIHTPGHTKGGVIFYSETDHIAFTGDTLFRMSIGRTDLPGGSWEELMNSLTQKVSKLPVETIIYPGHGPQSILKEEFIYNPYLHY